MRRAFRYRLYLNRAQTGALEAMLETHRKLYNSALQERRRVYEAKKRSISYSEQSGALKEARRANPHLAKTNFSSTQATLRRLEKAFKAFFRGVGAGEAPGYPRFKGKDRFDTIEFPSYGDGCKLKNNDNSAKLYLQHVGHVKVKLHRPVEGKIKTVSVKKSCGKWYVVFVCALGGVAEPNGEGPAVGIDLGLKAFLVASNGERIEPPRYHRKARKKLRRAQRVLCRRKKRSGRRRKARERLSRLHQRVANQRRDFHHKTARRLVDAHGLIAHEALNVRGLVRTRLAKSAHDAGWAAFLNILASKAEEAGVRVVAVDPKNTTQACSRCGALPEVKKTLSDRTHVCPSCGYVDDRDVNAARNILAKARAALGRSARDETQRAAANVS